MNETIVLRPTGRLQWKAKSRFEDPLEGTHVPWQEQWFDLGAKRKPLKEAVPRFWQMIAQACITKLCHIASNDPEVAEDLVRITTVALPDEAASWIEGAPPMEGLEYLNYDLLTVLWQRLLAWCREQSQEQGLAVFLRERAPHWQHVGRIFFHLAENKRDSVRPFAFLATYTVGLNEKGEPRHVPLSNALKRYVKAQDKAALVRLLEPLFEASKHVAWVKELVDTKAIYQPRPWTPKQAYAFLQSAEALQDLGIGVRLPNWWQKRPRPQIKAVVGSEKGSKLGADSLARVDISVIIGEEACDPKELEDLLNKTADGLVFFRGQWIEVDAEKLNQALAFWKKLEGQNIPFAKGMRLLAGIPLSPNDEEDLEEIRDWSFAEAGDGFKEIVQSARAVAETIDIPNLRANLRPYQQKGVAWLAFLGKLGLGACLADDMGLGKTIQILALLLTAQNGHPSLLIAPASLLANWQSEARKFAPTLHLLLLHGKSKAELSLFEQPGSFEGYDLVLMSYSGIARNPWIGNHQWQWIIADEAQAIKNAQTNQSRAVRALHGRAHIALTGTPIENRLQDLWAIFDFLLPGLLGSAKSFQALVKQLNEHKDHYAPLKRLTQPYILRRMKTDKSIIDSLPDKTVVPLSCHLTKTQAAQYLAVTQRLKADLEKLRENPDEAKTKRRVIVLQTIMLLKQICNHPDQASHGETYDPALSGKFTALKDVCETIAACQEKVLVFTQFREICEPLAQYLSTIFGHHGLVMHGGVPVAKRKDLVETFQDPDGPSFFVLSLKVGGTGLTLTEANHVIHFDRWWNPAVEDQASDRAFRIGQKKNVLVHTCITQGTLEERIDSLIAEKRDLAEEILGGRSEVNITAMSDEQIVDLVRLDATQGDFL